MEDSRAAKRYARALFQIAQKQEIVAAVEADFRSLKQLIDDDASFRNFVASPDASRDQKLQILDRLFSDRVTMLTLQALRLMFEKRREAEIPAVYAEFLDLRRRYANIAFTTVISAHVIDEDQKNALVAKLEKSLNQTVEARFEVDPKVIGGIKVMHDNEVLDGTLSGGLQRLRENLMYDLLKQA